VQEVYKEMSGLAASVAKSIEAIAGAIDIHADLIRELGNKRGDSSDVKSSDISSRPLRVVN
jgi:hypothetical protein